MAFDVVAGQLDPAGPPPEGWLTRLRQASFRGVPFFTRRTGLEIGRRQDLHEYPERDTPHAQDVGRRARRYKLEAFVVGPDYDLQRDLLIRAFERKGPGQLVTERFGTVRVSIIRARVEEESREGRWALLQVDAVEAGENLQPESIVATFDAVVEALEESSESFLVEYLLLIPSDPVGWVRGEVDRLTAAVVDNALTQGVDKLRDSEEGAKLRQKGRLLEAASASSSSPSSSATDDPALRGSELIDLHVETGQLETPSAEQRFRELQNLTVPSIVDVPELPGALDSEFFQRRLEVLLIPGELAIPPDLQGAYDLWRATNRLRTRSVVAARVHAAQALTIPSADEANRIRDDLLEQLDAEIEVAGLFQDDDAYLSLRDLRGTVLDDFSDRAELLPDLVSYTPPKTTSALLLAQRLYGTGERETELEERLAVPSPGFVPGGVEIRVLAQ